MHHQNETLHPILERWIERMVALVGRLCYLGVNDKQQLAFVFRQFFIGIGVIIMLLLSTVALPLLIHYLNELFQSLK